MTRAGPLSLLEFSGTFVVTTCGNLVTLLCIESLSLLEGMAPLHFSNLESFYHFQKVWSHCIGPAHGVNGIVTMCRVSSIATMHRVSVILPMCGASFIVTT